MCYLLTARLMDSDHTLHVDGNFNTRVKFNVLTLEIFQTYTYSYRTRDY